MTAYLTQTSPFFLGELRFVEPVPIGSGSICGSRQLETAKSLIPHWNTVPQQSFVFVLNDSVTFAGYPFKFLSIENDDFASAVANDPGPL